MLGRDLRCPPVNVGPRTTPDYAPWPPRPRHTIGAAGGVFAGQRADAFYVDLGASSTWAPSGSTTCTSISIAGAAGVERHRVQRALRRPSGPERRPHQGRQADPVGYRARSSASGPPPAAHGPGPTGAPGKYVGTGPWKQVSRLGNPLFNEVLVPMAEGPLERAAPRQTRVRPVRRRPPGWPGCAGALPGRVPDLAAYAEARADLDAILLTGIPAGGRARVHELHRTVASDMLRLNMAIPPSATEPTRPGRGRRGRVPERAPLGDDVVTVELRAVARLTLPLVDPSFTPDGAASAIADGTSNTNAGVTGSFPYLGLPGGGTRRCPAPPRRHEHRSPARHSLGSPTPARGRSCWTSSATSARWW